MSGGIVYCITNDEINFKIGKTSRSAEERARDIGKSTLDNKYYVKFFISVNDRNVVEKEAHDMLSSYRIRKDREFFNAPLDEIKRVFDLLETKYHNRLEDLEKELCDIIRTLQYFPFMCDSTVYIMYKRRRFELERRIDILVHGSETIPTKMCREFWNNKEICQDPENEVE
jgi:hypothetical protein